MHFTIQIIFKNTILKNSIKKPDGDNEHNKGPGCVIRNNRTKGTSGGNVLRQPLIRDSSSFSFDPCTPLAFGGSLWI